VGGKVERLMLLVRGPKKVEGFGVPCGHRRWKYHGVYWWYWAIVALLWNIIE